MSLFGTPPILPDISDQSCQAGQIWSGLANGCVAKEILTKASDDGSCVQGNYDSVSLPDIWLASVKMATDGFSSTQVLSMCLDISILGAPEPVNPSSTPVPTYTPADTDVNKATTLPSAMGNGIPLVSNTNRSHPGCSSADQRYDASAKACVRMDSPSKPMMESNCSSGQTYDSVSRRQISRLCC